MITDFGGTEYFDVYQRKRPDCAHAGARQPSGRRSGQLAEVGLSDADIADAVEWAREANDPGLTSLERDSKTAEPLKQCRRQTKVGLDTNVPLRPLFPCATSPREYPDATRITLVMDNRDTHRRRALRDSAIPSRG